MKDTGMGTDAVSDLRNKAAEERRKRYQLIRDCGYANPQWQRWTTVVAEASEQIKAKHNDMSISFEAAPTLSSYKLRTRVVPVEFVPVSAEDIVGMQAALSEARERVYELEAERAEIIRRSTQIGWPHTP